MALFAVAFLVVGVASAAQLADLTLADLTLADLTLAGGNAPQPSGEQGGAAGATDDDSPSTKATAEPRPTPPPVPTSMALASTPLLSPGPALWSAGASGDDVRRLQARLIQIDWLPGPVSGTFDADTVAAVRGFQKKREIPITGEVDQRTLDRLVAMTYPPTHAQMYNLPTEPGQLDPRCTYGRVPCVDKSSRSLRWVIDGKVQARYDARFGSDELPTREGEFHVYMKSRDHVSRLYDTSMPLAMFFSGGQAVHYSPDFAAHGYAGNSHGCVNIRDYDGISWLFDQVRVSDRVIVYWS
jgi:lipoprotein-anchoring transpeptidase ErfK/SrfK